MLILGKKAFLIMLFMIILLNPIIFKIQIVTRQTLVLYWKTCSYFQGLYIQP